MGGEIAIPDVEMNLLDESRAGWLDSLTNQYNEKLPPLDEFILPGGSEFSSRLHISRTECRDAERRIIALSEDEYVSDSHGKDIRIVVVGGKVVGGMKRESNDGDFRANITRGGGAKPIEIDEQMEYLALETTNLLGLDISGVDLLYDNGGYKICEINSSPGFQGMEKYTDIKVAEQIVNYIKIKLGYTNGNH